MQQQLLERIAEAESLYKEATKRLETLIRWRFKHAGEMPKEQAVEFFRIRRQLENELTRLHCPELRGMPAVDEVPLWKIGPATVGAQENPLDVLDAVSVGFAQSEIIGSLAPSRNNVLKWFASLRKEVDNTPSVDDSVPTPFWNSETRELMYGKKVSKQFKRPAPNQILLLETFQKGNWPAKVDNPWPNDVDPQRLRDTVRGLNEPNRYLHFELNGTGGILWKPKSRKAKPPR